jgi:protein TonB
VSKPKPQAQAKPKAQAKAPAETAQAGAASAARAKSLQAGWGAKIQSRVHRNLRYPRGETATGTARVALTILRNGQLAGAKLVRSSGHAALDRAALAAVNRAGRFPKAPSELAQASYSFTIALTFTR